MNAYNLVDKAAMYGLKCVQIADNFSLLHHSEKQLFDLYQYATQKKVSIETGTRGLQKSNILRYLDISQILQSPILRVVIDAFDFEP